MRNLDRRVQILLDEPRYIRVSAEARRRGVSVAAVIRDAIDELPVSDERRRKAVAEILAAEPMSLPVDPADLRLELNHAHERSP